MTALKRLLVATATATLLHLPANAADFQKGDIKIVQPWSRATPGGAKVAGGFMTLTNTGKTADRLIGGSAVVTGVFEVHEMSMTDGIMRMRMLRNGLEIKPGETVVLKPGSFHVMFMELKQPLARGDKIKGTLVFEKAGTVEIEYEVAALGAQTPDGAAKPAGNSGGHKH